MFKFLKSTSFVFILLSIILGSRSAFTAVVFELVKLDAGQPFMTEIPRLKDKSLVCDNSSIYWSLIAPMKIRGSGVYRIVNDEPSVYQVIVRDSLGRHIVVRDDGALLRLAYSAPSTQPRRFDFEIRLSELCLANRDRQFAPDEFIDYVRSLTIEAARIL